MMTRKSFVVLMAIAVLMLVGTVGAFASGQQQASKNGKVTLTFNDNWKAGTPGDSAVALPLLAKWEKAHPNIHLSINTVVGDEERNVIRTDAAANNLPDVWWFWVGNVLADYAHEGLLLNMDKYLAASKVVNKSDINAAAWKLATFNGKRVAIPIATTLGSFFVNTAIFKKYGMSYPKTWSEFIKDGKFFRAHGVTPTNIGSKGGNPSHFWYNQLCDQYKSCWKATEDIATSLSYQDPSFLKAAQYVNQMREAGMFPKDVVANGDWGPSIALYNQGNVAMGYTFPWDYTLMKPAIVAKTQIIPVPKLPDGNVSPTTFTEGSAANGAWAAHAQSWDNPAKRAAMTELLNFLERTIGIADVEAGVNTSPDQVVMAKADLSKIKNPMARKAIQYQLKSKESGAPMIWQDMPNNRLQFVYQSQALDPLWAGAMTPQKFIQTIQKGLDTYKANHKS